LLLGDIFSSSFLKVVEANKAKYVALHISRNSSSTASNFVMTINNNLILLIVLCRRCAVHNMCWSVGSGYLLSIPCLHIKIWSVWRGPSNGRSRQHPTGQPSFSYSAIYQLAGKVVTIL